MLGKYDRTQKMFFFLRWSFSSSVEWPFHIQQFYDDDNDK